MALRYRSRTRSKIAKPLLRRTSSESKVGQVREEGRRLKLACFEDADGIEYGRRIVICLTSKETRRAEDVEGRRRVQDNQGEQVLTKFKEARSPLLALHTKSGHGDEIIHEQFYLDLELWQLTTSDKHLNKPKGQKFERNVQERT